MCGFLIKYGNNDDEPKNLPLKVPTNLSNRGPSSFNEHSNNNIKSTFHRLAIKGDPEATQPIYTTNGMLAYGNGQIFNFEQIGKKIMNKNFVKAHEEDDIHLAVEYLSQDPEKNWEKLDGMFALVLIDPKSDTIYLGRDKTGEKPLFYRIEDTEIIASSLIEPIIMNSEKKVHINQDSIHCWLRYGLLEPGTTFFKNIYEVEPGSIVVYKDNKIICRKYWRWPYRGEGQIKNQETENILKNSIITRIEKSENIALSLSSGIDSGAVLGVSRKMKFFNTAIMLQFRNDIFDEVSTFNLDLLSKLILVDRIVFEDKLSANLVHKVIDLMDQPISDMSCIPFYMICEQAVMQHKIMMTGDGGDELFCGYRAFKYEKIANIMWIFTSFISRNFRKRMLNYVLGKADIKYLSKSNLLARFLAGSLATKKNRWAVALSSNFALQVFAENLTFATEYNFPQKLEIYFQDFIFPQIYLQKADRMSMGQGLELRTPFLSNPFLEYSMTISRKVLNKYGKPHSTCLIPELYQSGRSPKRGLGVPATEVLALLKEPNWGMLLKWLQIEVIKNVWDLREKNVAMAQLAWNFYVLNYYLEKWASLGVDFSKYPDKE